MQMSDICSISIHSTWHSNYLHTQFGNTCSVLGQVPPQGKPKSMSDFRHVIVTLKEAVKRP